MKKIGWLLPGWRQLGEAAKQKYAAYYHACPETVQAVGIGLSQSLHHFLNA